MIDKWTDRRRAEFVRYRNECLRRERREVRFMALAGVAAFLVGLVCGLLLC